MIYQMRESNGEPSYSAIVPARKDLIIYSCLLHAVQPNIFLLVDILRDQLLPFVHSDLVFRSTGKHF
jgi:hypothetical protein